MSVVFFSKKINTLLLSSQFTKSLQMFCCLLLPLNWSTQHLPIRKLTQMGGIYCSRVQCNRELTNKRGDCRWGAPYTQTLLYWKRWRPFKHLKYIDITIFVHELEPIIQLIIKKQICLNLEHLKLRQLMYNASSKHAIFSWHSELRVDSTIMHAVSVS